MTAPKLRRGPSGKMLRLKAWSAEWDSVFGKLRALGFQVHGFDPSIELSLLGDTVGAFRQFTMPLWAVALIIEGTAIPDPRQELKDVKAHREALKKQLGGIDLGAEYAKLSIAQHRKRTG